ncbi:MAG: glycosyltransferase family 1 protein [Cytophagales bacterium]|nr:glycosyltransferase family 1 protein [Cytophagales bacterium]
MRAKKVLINAMHLRGNFSGVHRYTEHLLRHMENSDLQIDSLQPIDRTTTSNLFPKTLPRLNRVWYEQIRMNRDFRSGEYGLYHATNYILPLFWQGPSVLTVHDTIALDFPELCKDETALYYGLMLRHSIEKSNRVLAVSEQVRQDIMRHAHIPKERIMVTQLGVDPAFKRRPFQEDLARVRKKYDLPTSYFLFVGNLEPKKNLSRLIEAFHHLLPQLDESFQLVMAGQKGWKYMDIFKTIERLKIQSRVRLLDYVPQKDLPALYHQASVFAFPSLYEGFGLPAIEAMACGTPVLISDRGALPEVTGGFARQVNPLDVHEISIGLFEQLTQSKQERLIDAQEWVKQYQWAKTAEKTLTVYNEVLENAVFA